VCRDEKVGQRRGGLAEVEDRGEREGTARSGVKGVARRGRTVGRGGH